MNDESRQRGESEPAVQRRDWRRVHHSPLFWIGIVLCLAAITIYVMSNDLSWRPHTQRSAELPVSGAFRILVPPLKPLAARVMRSRFLADGHGRESELG